MFPFIKEKKESSVMLFVLCGYTKGEEPEAAIGTKRQRKQHHLLAYLRILKLARDVEL